MKCTSCNREELKSLFPSRIDPETGEYLDKGIAHVRCSRCSGTGWLDAKGESITAETAIALDEKGVDVQMCPTCSSSGLYVLRSTTVRKESVPCKRCGGRGEIAAADIARSRGYLPPKTAAGAGSNANSGLKKKARG